VPGILCCVDRTEGVFPVDQVNKMLGSMKHDKSYFSEFVVDSQGCSMGAVELDILRNRCNLLHTDQRINVAFRGSIFNLTDLSKKFGVNSTSCFVNNAKFVAELYKMKDLGFVEYLNGLFSVAIFDKEKEAICVANDRYGYFPLFYGLTSKNLVFASEAKAVVKGLGISPQLNEQAIPDFLAFSFLLGNKTFFKGVQKVPPASIILYSKKTNKLDFRRYWDFSLKKYNSSVPLTTYLEEFNSLMKKSVEKRVEDCDKIGLFLSGGLDSRVIAAFVSETKTPVVTFTFGVRGCEEENIASDVSEILGLEHHFFEIPSNFIAENAQQIVYAGDGLIRIRDCHFISLLRKVREYVCTVLLGTFGGDLTCRPEGRLSTKMLKSKTRQEVADFILNYYTKVVSNVIPISEHETVFTKEFFRKIKNKTLEEFTHTFDEIDFNSPADIGDYWEYRNREPRYIFQASQHVNWLLESRHPFLDNDLVDFFALRFPVFLRRKEIMGVTFEDTFLQRALDLRFPSLRNVKWHGFKPNTNRYEVLALEGVRYLRKKMGKSLEKIVRRKVQTGNPDFRGYDQWLREDSKNFVISTLLNERARERSIFRNHFVNTVINEHMNYRADNNQIICDMINLELMQELFFAK
jgi:asparagine synthase (glutamine-hydrolysing)